MSNVLRRLRKLEAQLTDRSTYTPHSEAWFQHWSDRCDQFLTTGDGAAIQGMPLAFIDDVVAGDGRDEQPNESDGISSPSRTPRLASVRTDGCA